MAIGLGGLGGLLLYLGFPYRQRRRGWGLTERKPGWVDLPWVPNLILAAGLLLVAAAVVRFALQG